MINGLIQGAVGGIIGGVTGRLMDGKDGFWKGFASGFACSFISGAIAGGIAGYNNAIDAGANKWTGAAYRNGEEYFTSIPTRGNTPLMESKDKYCYAHVAEFQTGTPYQDVIKIMDGAEGADAWKTINSIGGYTMIQDVRIPQGENFRDFGAYLAGGYHVDAAIKIDQYDHNVAVLGIRLGQKLRIIGGGWKNVFRSAYIWDPASGFRNYNGKFERMVGYY